MDLQRDPAPGPAYLRQTVECCGGDVELGSAALDGDGTTSDVTGQRQGVPRPQHHLCECPSLYPDDDCMLDVRYAYHIKSATRTH